MGDADTKVATEVEAPITSEKIFRTRLTGALRKGSVRELRSIWNDPQLEPHMTLFVLLVCAFVTGIVIWIVEPLFVR